MPADITDQKTTRRGRVRTERSPKRIRALLGGHLVFDTVGAVLVWEVPYYPTYYIPLQDVSAELIATGRQSHSPSRGDGEGFDVRSGEAEASGAALRYSDSPIEALRELIRFDWASMDEWLEEDEPVYTHARDPYTRVDILSSSRHVQVMLDGIRIADSSAPAILFETGLPARYYLPMTDVRTELLTASVSESHCPYKGTASYWHLDVNGRRYDDFVWCYRAPLPESQKIAGRLCFYNEKVDLVLDGQLLDRPVTKFSR